MKAILLCAGFGTRLFPITKNRPNALLDIGGRPVLDYQMDQLLELDGLTEIHVVANSRFASHFYLWWPAWRDRCHERGVPLRLHNDGSLDEERRLGEVGDLAFVARVTDTSKGALVSAGDNIYRFRINTVWERFRDTGENMVLAFPETHHQVLQQHTVIEFDDTGMLRRVHVQPEHPPSHWICPNLYFLRPEALELLDVYLQASGERDRLASFLAYLLDKQPVRALRMPDGSQRLHINTRYMYEKAKTVLSTEGVLAEAT